MLNAPGQATDARLLDRRFFGATFGGMVEYVGNEKAHPHHYRYWLARRSEYFAKLSPALRAAIDSGGDPSNCAVSDLEVPGEDWHKLYDTYVEADLFVQAIERGQETARLHQRYGQLRRTVLATVTDVVQRRGISWPADWDGDPLHHRRWVADVAPGVARELNQLQRCYDERRTHIERQRLAPVEQDGSDAERNRLYQRRFQLRKKLPPRTDVLNFAGMRRHYTLVPIADELERIENRLTEIKRERPPRKKPEPKMPPVLPEAELEQIGLRNMQARTGTARRRWLELDVTHYGQPVTAAWKAWYERLRERLRVLEVDEYESRLRDWDYWWSEARAGRAAPPDPSTHPRRPSFLVEMDRENKVLAKEQHFEHMAHVAAARFASRTQGIDPDAAVVDPKNAKERARQAMVAERRQRKERWRKERNHVKMVKDLLDWAWGVGRSAPGSPAVLVPAGAPGAAGAGEQWVWYPDGGIAWQTQRMAAIEAVGVSAAGGWAFPPVGAAARTVLAVGA
jgi:hypothetical protein